MGVTERVRRHIEVGNVLLIRSVKYRMSTSKHLARRYGPAAAAVVASVALVVSVQSNPGLGAAEDLPLVSPESVGMISERLGRISTHIRGVYRQRSNRRSDLPGGSKKARSSISRLTGGGTRKRTCR